MTQVFREWENDEEDAERFQCWEASGNWENDEDQKDFSVGKSLGIGENDEEISVLGSFWEYVKYIFGMLAVYENTNCGTEEKWMEVLKVLAIQFNYSNFQFQ